MFCVYTYYLCLILPPGSSLSREAPVFYRQDAGTLFEKLREAAGRGITYHLCDLPRGEVSVDKQVLRLTHAPPLNILRHGAAHLPLEAGFQLALAHARDTGQPLQRDIKGVVIGNIAHHVLQPAQARKNTASMQQKVNIDNTASPVYNDTSKIMGGVSGVARTGIAADSNGVPGIHQGSDTVYRREEESRRAAVSSGLVLLNDKSQATLRERGVAVEAKDASADKAAFSAALASARESDAEHGWAVTPNSAQELAESGARLITAQNWAAGLAVAKQV